MRAQFKGAAQQAGFGGIAAAQNSVDNRSAADGIAIADERGSIEKVESRIAGLVFLERAQQARGFVISSQVVVTGGEQERGLLLELRCERDGPLEAGGGFGVAAHLEIGKS